MLFRVGVCFYMRPTSWLSLVYAGSRGSLSPGKVISIVSLPTRAYASLGQRTSVAGAGARVTRGGQVGLAYSEVIGWGKVLGPVSWWVGVSCVSIGLGSLALLLLIQGLRWASLSFFAWVMSLGTGPVTWGVQPSPLPQSMHPLPMGRSLAAARGSYRVLGSLGQDTTCRWVAPGSSQVTTALVPSPRGGSWLGVSGAVARAQGSLSSLGYLWRSSESSLLLMSTREAGGWGLGRLALGTGASVLEFRSSALPSQSSLSPMAEFLDLSALESAESLVLGFSVCSGSGGSGAPDWSWVDKSLAWHTVTSMPLEA